MRVEGKLIHKKIEWDIRNGAIMNAEIELAPVDISKLKKGDIIWVEKQIPSNEPIEHFVNRNKKIIAHFPAPKLKTYPCGCQTTDEKCPMHTIKLPDCILKDNHNLLPREEILAEKIDKIINYLKQKEQIEKNI